MTATFPITVLAKTRNFTNGTANDAGPVDASYVDLYNNDASLATGLNDIGGSSSVNGFIDGKNLILRNYFSGAPAGGDNCGEGEVGGSAQA